MSDFKLLDDDAGSQNPQTPPPSHPPASQPPASRPPTDPLIEPPLDALPEREAGFQFSVEPKAGAMPGPGRTVGAPRVPQQPTPPAAGPPVGGQRPLGVPGQTPVAGQPEAGAPRPANAPLRPAPRPVAPTPTVIPSPPASILKEEEAPEIQSMPPEDDFSYKLWSIGQSFKKVLDVMSEPASWVLRISFVVGISCLAYLLAGLFLGKPALNPNLAKYLMVAAHVFAIAAFCGSISALIAGYEDNRLGFIVGGIGVLFYFVIPLVLFKVMGSNVIGARMGADFRHFGYYLVFVGLAKGLFDIGGWLWSLPEKMKERHATVGVSNRAEAKQRAIARSANMFSPCWQLPFCRESIRKQCPAFIAKKTCWKFGRGCYCDEEMISRIVRGEEQNAIKAPTRMSQKGKAPCGRCYIYLEHQTYKFRMLSPLALPATVLATWGIWPIYTRVFALGNNAFNSLWTQLSFNSTSVTPDILKATGSSMDTMKSIGDRPEDIAHIAQTMFGVLLGFMLLIYISKTIEYAIFKAKL